MRTPDRITKSGKVAYISGINNENTKEVMHDGKRGISGFYIIHQIWRGGWVMRGELPSLAYVLSFHSGNLNATVAR